MRLSLSSKCNGLCFCLACVFCLVSCGGAKMGPDGNSGASKKLVEDDSTDGMQETQRLTPLGDSPSATNVIDECRLEGNLPDDVPEGADAETLHALGQERILGKNGPEAVIILSAAAKLDPENASIIGDFATALLQCRFFDEAILNARQAAALEPNNVDIAANLAQTYQIAGRIDEAVYSYRKAIEVSPGDHAAHNNLAVLLVLSDLQEAEKEARAASNLAPDNASYLVNLGYILLRQKRFTDAEIILGRSLEVDPDNADAHNQFGLVLAAQKKNKEATDHFRKALELRPDHMAAKENLEAMEEGFDFIGPWNKK